MQHTQTHTHTHAQTITDESSRSVDETFDLSLIDLASAFGKVMGHWL